MGHHEISQRSGRRIERRVGRPWLRPSTACLLALLASAILQWAAQWLWIVIIGSGIGGLVENVLRATLETSGVLNREVLAFLNTAVGSLADTLLVWSLT